jgi:hypothetical protein
MSTLNSAENFFKWARERGAENETDISNDEEIKKELQPGTKNNYRRALALWHQWVLRIMVDLPRPTLHRTRLRTDCIEGFKVLAQVVYPLMGHTDFLGDLERRYTGSQAGFDCAADRVRIFEIYGH